VRGSVPLSCFFGPKEEGCHCAGNDSPEVLADRQCATGSRGSSPSRQPLSLRCSICCRETSVIGELQSLCLLTQCLCLNSVKFKFATTTFGASPARMEAKEPQHPPEFCCGSVFRSEESYGINRASNNTRLSIRHHCGLDRRTWIWSGAAG